MRTQWQEAKGHGDGGKKSAGAGAYPRNITVSNFAYFLVVPTLCYQPVYPRSDRIRKRWLLKRFFELLACLGLMAFLVSQMFPGAS